MSDLNTLRIDGARLLQRLRDLGQCGALEGGGTNRLALSDADQAARDWTVQQMRDLGMEVQIDAIGNVVATYAGTEADALPVMTGSHIDTVRTGGLYDGNYGVMAGLEVVATLRDAGLRTRRALQVAFFTNEEGARFQPDMLGSLVMWVACRSKQRWPPKLWTTAHAWVMNCSALATQAQPPWAHPRCTALWNCTLNKARCWSSRA